MYKEENRLKNIVEEFPWEEWGKFPNPSQYGTSLRLIFRKILSKSNRPGVYQVRDKNTHEWILFGEGGSLEVRMGSLLPQSDGGVGTRRNSSKRKDISKNINDREYRVLYTETKEEAKEIDSFLKSLKLHRFNT